MSIPFECPNCWRDLSLDEGLASTTVRCVHCLTTFELPQPSTSESYGLAEPVACPSCRATLAADAVLCIHCGHDFRTGNKHRRKIDEMEVSHRVGGLTYRIRRDERGRWTLTLEGRILGIWRSAGNTFDLRKYQRVVAVYEHDGWNDNDGDVSLSFETPTGKREQFYFGDDWDFVNWLQEHFRDEVGMQWQVERR